MKSISIFFTALLILSLNCLSAQVPADTIEIKKGLETSFRLNGKKLKPKQLLELTKNNAEANTLMKTAKSNYTAAYIFSSAGGYLIGYQLGYSIGGGKANWTVAGVGGALFLASLPFSGAYAKHAKKAVTVYNKGLNQVGFKKVWVYPALSSDGVGLRVKF
jgi:hypothetical protein